ncbi:MAG: non-ribosomal peptide synthetase [Acidimicrobiales bacterium]|nr:non-ribosomal peptide synthetase [Acidimicrobiales bacterium]
MSDQSPPAEAPPGAAPWGPDRPRPDGYEPFPAAAVEGSIGARFRDVAARHADHVALRSPAGAWTFAELETDANRFANALLARLGEDEEPVALLFDHDGPLVAAMLGTLSAGKLVLVLDPEAAPSVTESLLADSGARLLVADASRIGAAFDLAGPDVAVVRDSALVEGAPTTPPPVDVAPDRGAMLAYTSGSSGSAKAAVIPHRALLHLMRGATDALSISPGDTLPMLFPVSLAVAAYPMFLPLLNGGTLTTRDVRGLGLVDLGKWISEERISVMYVAPTVARFMVDVVAGFEYPALRLVVLGGERVDADAVALVRDLFGQHLVVANGYGTTETGVLTFYFVAPGESFGDAGVPVGHPIEGMGLEIRREDGTPADVGAAGELFVRSPYLLRGYWGRPDLDAKVLSVGPDGVPVYRTGDVARVTADGYLEVAGRTDDQVKIRGQRIIPGEVEDALLALDVVKDAVVTTGTDATGTRILIAHVVPTSSETSADEVRRELAERVTAAMVPSRVLLRDDLPQLPNGKLDRQALIDGVDGGGGHGPADGDSPDGGVSRPAPADELEAQIIDLWQELLGVPEVHVDDDFFDLGGYSLLAAQMLVRLEERHGHQVQMSALLDGTTVADLARAIRGDTHHAGEAALVQAGAADRPALFLTHDLYGSAYRYRHLAAALGSDQTLYSFESPFLDGHRLPIRTIDTLARRYLSEVRRIQPEGPYYLAGYSFGGILAYEMARILERDGDEVAFLGIIDVGPGYRGIDYSRQRPPQSPYLGIPTPAEPDWPLRQRARYYAGLAKRSPQGLVRQLMKRARIDRWVQPVLWELDLRRTGQIRPGHRLWYSWYRLWRLAGPDWAPAPYGGDLTLYWAGGTGATDSTMGWAEWVGGTVDVQRVAAGHWEVMAEDGVGEVAGLIRADLDAAIARQSG